MHSSRMHTICSSGHLLGGGGVSSWGSAPGGCLLLGGVCSWGMSALGECLLLGGVCPQGNVCSWGDVVLQHALRQIPPMWTDRHL